MDKINQCPSFYQDIFSNPLVFERFILIIYLFIFLIGLIGNIMTIIIIKYNAYLRTPTNFYLLNLAVSDLMMLMCNLPLEMIEIYNREWPLSIIFCKLRNICAEFFTCSSILTILAFTCERYFAIVHPIHLHRLSHFRRAQNIIIIIWLISLAFSLPFGLSYEIETISANPTTLIFINNNTKLIQSNLFDKMSMKDCKSCVPKKTHAKILSFIIIITSFCFFYIPMIIIGAIYLFIGKSLRRVNKYEGYSNQIEISTSSQSSNGTILRNSIDNNYYRSGVSNKDGIEMQQQGLHINSYSSLKMRARCQARQVVVKTLVAVVIAFFVCYAPLYLQRLLIAITTLNPNFNSETPLLLNFLAYLYIISGITFYFGSVINPILYNVVSNKYRRAFRDLFCCRLTHRKRLNNANNQKNNRLQQQMHYCIRQRKPYQTKPQYNTIKLLQNNNNTNQPITLKNPIVTNIYSTRSHSSREKNKYTY